MAARRLPVLQNNDDPQRPPWQWVIIGAGLSLTSWLPLAVLAAWIARRITTLGAAQSWPVIALSIVPSALSFVLAGMLGGALITHFGSAVSSKRAALSGLLAAFGAWLLALLAGALRPWPVALVSLLSLSALGAGAGYGGSFLVRLRARRRIKKADPRAGKT